MHKIDELAFVSVGRGCGFTVLGIATFMFAMSYDMSLALQTGGIMGLVVCLILLMRAARAPQNPYKRTELWLMLPVTERPPETLAQMLVGSALKRTYMQFAFHFAFGSALLLVGSVLLRVLRSLI